MKIQTNKNKSNMMYKIIIGMVLVVFYQSIYALDLSEYVKHWEINETYFCNKSTTIEINNKYGNVYLMPWEKDSINFIVEITISSDSEVQLLKLEKSIDIQFTATPHYVIANTNFKQYSESIFDELADIMNSLFNGINNHVEINYTVQLPKYAKVTLENKFGNVYIGDYDGVLNLSLSNGDLRANKLTNSDIRLNLSFGKATISLLKNAKINSKFVDITIKEGNDVSIISRSGNLQLENINVLHLDSKRNTIYIENTKIVKGETMFSDIKIEDLKTELFLNSKYGSVDLHSFDEDFSNISINIKFADLTVQVSKYHNFNLLIQHEKADLFFSKPIENITKELIDSKRLTYKSKAYIGKNKNSLSTLNINAEVANVSLMLP